MKYKDFNKLITELKKLSDYVIKTGFGNHNITLGNGFIYSLEKTKEELEDIVSRIEKVKRLYGYSCDFDCFGLGEGYYLLWSNDNKLPVALYHDYNRKVHSILFEDTCGVLTIFPDFKGFILIEKEKSYYNFNYISEFRSFNYFDVVFSKPNEKRIISGVKNWKDLNDNLIIFELIDDKGSALYDKSSNRILFEGVDSVRNLDKQLGNYFPNKNYLVEKILHFENEDLVLKFFIDESGNVVSDLFDSNFCLYEIKNRNCREKVSSTLNQLFREIEKNYMRNGYQLVKKEK